MWRSFRVVKIIIIIITNLFSVVKKRSVKYTNIHQLFNYTFIYK